MNKIILKVLFLIFVMYVYNVYGQKTYGGKPLTLDSSLTNLLKVTPTLPLPSVDYHSEIKRLKDLGFQKTEIALARGFAIDTNFFEAAANFQIEGGCIYLLRMQSKKTYSITVSFSHFEIPIGAMLFIYNEQDPYYTVGALLYQNGLSNKHVTCKYIPGNTVIIEYFVPTEATTLGILELGTIGLGFVEELW